VETPPTFEAPTSRVWHLRTGESSDGEVHGEDRGLLESALLADEYDDVFVLTGPSRTLVPVLAAIARLRGRSLPR
jgi:hypothetical protein